MDCSQPGSSVQGILQARKLEWVAIPFSRDLPDPGFEPKSPVWQILYCLSHLILMLLLLLSHFSCVRLCATP